MDTTSLTLIFFGTPGALPPAHHLPQSRAEIHEAVRLFLFKSNTSSLTASLSSSASSRSRSRSRSAVAPRGRKPVRRPSQAKAAHFAEGRTGTACLLHPPPQLAFPLPTIRSALSFSIDSSLEETPAAHRSSPSQREEPLIHFFALRLTLRLPRFLSSSSPPHDYGPSALIVILTSLTLCLAGHAAVPMSSSTAPVGAPPLGKAQLCPISTGCMRWLPFRRMKSTKASKATNEGAHVRGSVNPLRLCSQVYQEAAPHVHFTASKRRMLPAEAQLQPASPR